MLTARKEFVVEAFGYAEVDWKAHVATDPRYFRPTEVDFLQGDASKAKNKLGWKPEISFKDLVRMMVDADIKELNDMKHSKDVIRKLSNRKDLIVHT